MSHPRLTERERFFAVPKNKVSNDTTYTLVASLISGTQEYKTDFKPIYQYATLTITVNNPTLTGLTVAGNVNAQSALNVNGPLSVSKTLSVTEDVTLQRNVRVYGTLNANRDLTVSGDLEAKRRLDVRGLLTANSDLTVGYGGETKLTTYGFYGLKVLNDFEVQDKMTTYGVNGLEVLKDLTVKGRSPRPW